MDDQCIILLVSHSQSFTSAHRGPEGQVLRGSSLGGRNGQECTKSAKTISKVKDGAPKSQQENQQISGGRGPLQSVITVTHRTRLLATSTKPTKDLPGEDHRQREATSAGFLSRSLLIGSTSGTMGHSQGQLAELQDPAHHDGLVAEEEHHHAPNLTIQLVWLIDASVDIVSAGCPSQGRGLIR